MELVRHERFIAELAREFDPCYATILRWAHRAEQADEPKTDEDEKLKRLHRENRKLRQEREILTNPWPYASEIGSTAGRSTRRGPPLRERFP